MPYVICYSPTAERQIRALDPIVQRRILGKLGGLAEDPRPPGCVKLAGYEKLWWIRIGDWRVVYSIDDERKHIEITIVAHRRESYRGL